MVGNDIVKKTIYDELVTKVNAIDTSGFVLKTWYNTNKLVLEKKIDDAAKKIPATSRLVKKIDYNAMITEIDDERSRINGLVTTTVLSAVENKISNVGNLVKKTDYDVKISDIEAKYFTTSDYNKFTGEMLDKKIKEKELVNKSDISGFIDNPDLDKRKQN